MKKKNVSEFRKKLHKKSDFQKKDFFQKREAKLQRMEESLQEMEEQLQKEQDLNEELSRELTALKMKEEQALIKELSEELAALKKEREQELAEGTEEFINEARLKNEAYAFIIAQGLLDKFLNSKFRDEQDSTEKALNFLLMDTTPIDDWLICIREPEEK